MTAQCYDSTDLIAILFFALIAIGCLVAMVVERWRRRDSGD
jgi:hypothetical protein